MSRHCLSIWIHRSFFIASTIVLLSSAASAAQILREHGPGSSSSKLLVVSGFTLPDAPSPQTPDPSIGEGSAPGSMAPQHDAFPARRERSKAYLSDLIGPGAFISPIVQAAVDQTRDLKVGYPSDGYTAPGKHPAHGAIPEWGQGFDGYSKRYASRFGMGLISTTSRYGLGELLHEDVSYHRCQCVGVFPRTYHALTQSLIAHTHSGKSIPSLPALVSPFIAAEVATEVWYPAWYNASDALRTSTSLYYGLPLKNLVKEFGKH